MLQVVVCTVGADILRLTAGRVLKMVSSLKMTGFTYNDISSLTKPVLH